MKDGLGYNTSKSYHKTVARRRKAETAEKTIKAVLWALGPYKYTHMARVSIYMQEVSLRLQVLFVK